MALKESDVLMNVSSSRLQKVRGGEWKGYTGKAMTDVVNVGIGGSDLVCSNLLALFRQCGMVNCFISYCALLRSSFRDHSLSHEISVRV